METVLEQLKLNKGDLHKLREGLRQAGQFIANHEEAFNKLKEQQHHLEALIKSQHTAHYQQLQEITQTVEDFRNILTEAGIARWRIAAEQNLKQGQEHLETLQEISEQQLKKLETEMIVFTEFAKESYDRLDQSTHYTVKNMAETLNTFRISDFQRLTDESIQKVSDTTQSAIEYFRRLVRRFYWRNFAWSLAISVLVMVGTGLYINDEFPWEMHKNVVEQRHAGQTLLKAWPILTHTEQQKILAYGQKS